MFPVHRVPQDAIRKRRGWPGTAKQEQMRSQRLAPREARALALSCHVLLAGHGYPWPDRGRLRRRRTGRETPGWERRARIRPWRRGTPLGGRRVTADMGHRRVEREGLPVNRRSAWMRLAKRPAVPAARAPGLRSRSGSARSPAAPGSASASSDRGGLSDRPRSDPGSEAASCCWRAPGGAPGTAAGVRARSFCSA